MSCHGKHGSLPTFQMFHGGVQGKWLGIFFKGRIFQHEDWHKWYRMPMLVSGTTLFVRFSAKKNVYATCDFGSIEGKLDCRSSGFLLARFIHIVLVGDFMALQTGSPLRLVVYQIGWCLFPGDCGDGQASSSMETFLLHPFGILQTGSTGLKAALTTKVRKVVRIALLGYQKNRHYEVAHDAGVTPLAVTVGLCGWRAMHRLWALGCRILSCQATSLQNSKKKMCTV